MRAFGVCKANSAISVKLLSRYSYIVPDREVGNCLDPELPGTGLQERGKKGPGPPRPSKKSQLEPNRDGETMGRGKEESIQDMMEEDQWPTE
jgi:hypothetical protein